MGEDADFTEYVSSRWAALVRSARLLGADSYEAEDMVQTALARCYVSWRRIKAADHPDAYVYRVLVNVYRDSWRRRWRRERPTAALPDLPDRRDQIADVDDADLIEKALGHLGDANRSVIILRYFAHLSERETAEALGISESAVKSRAFRAMATLASYVDSSDQRPEAP